MISIIFDTETTGLLLPKTADLDKQPHITELAAALIEDGVVLSEHEWMFDPEVPITPEITKITGITNEMVAGKPKFRQVLGEIEDLFAQADVMIAHNASFDKGMLETELVRCERTGFPWPAETLCTVGEYMHIKGRRLKLTELYELKLNKKLEQKHRALDDVRALCEIVLIEKLA